VVALNFSARFVPLVESRLKRQTIRVGARVKPGQAIQLYTGMRTKACRKLVTPDPICDTCMYIGLTAQGITLSDASKFPRNIDEFARADGFKDFHDMWDWFFSTYKTMSFTGHVIRWTFET
jgi:hypothetical protein